MLISFVIPAHNEERLIGATVNALHRAARELGVEYEVVVAADTCTDRTAVIAAGAGARVVACDHRQISKARNAGAAAAAGDRLIFVDADTVVPPGAVREALDAWRTGAAGGGAPIQFDGEIPGWAKIMLPATLWLFRVARFTGGCFLFCTREALNAAGGWDETLYASEELTLASAIKRRFGRKRFVIIRARVLTSGRKLRDYSGWEIVRILTRITLSGRGAVRRREGLELWYERRWEGPNGGA